MYTRPYLLDIPNLTYYYSTSCGRWVPSSRASARAARRTLTLLALTLSLTLTLTQTLTLTLTN